MVDGAVRTRGCKSSVYGICLLYRAIRVDMGYVNFACLRRNEWSGLGITDGCHRLIDELCPRDHTSSSSKSQRFRCRCITWVLHIAQLSLQHGCGVSAAAELENTDLTGDSYHSIDAKDAIHR